MNGVPPKQVISLLMLLLVLLPTACTGARFFSRPTNKNVKTKPSSTVSSSSSSEISIAAVRSAYDDYFSANDPLSTDLFEEVQEQPNRYFFPRFQSPASIQRLVDSIIVRHGRRSSSSRRTSRSNKKSRKESSSTSSSSPSPFQKYKGPNSREGYVRSNKLRGTDWVLAESKQVAVDCTPQEVLETYLSGKLQREWNQDKVIDCRITKCQQPTKENNDDEPYYYQQDLVLKSQRVITSQTGIMRYSQKITIDKIMNNDDDDDKDARYCVSVQLLKDGATTTTVKKPFESLSVYVNLEPRQDVDEQGMIRNDVHIYAAGLMQVNRQVVPNLVVFDASGIAGSMAGKGTLWLTAYFKQRYLAKNKTKQQQKQQQPASTLTVASSSSINSSSMASSTAAAMTYTHHHHNRNGLLQPSAALWFPPFRRANKLLATATAK